MKNVLIIIMMFLFSGAYSQTPDSTTISKVESFLSCRTISFNDSVDPQPITNFDAELKKIRNSNINYTYSIHKFYKELKPDMWMGLSCKARGGGIEKQFIMYTTYEENGVVYLKVLFGNNGW